MHKKKKPFPLNKNDVNCNILTQDAVTVCPYIREESSNSVQEMVAVLGMAGFQVWDVNMHNLCSGAITLNNILHNVNELLCDICRLIDQ